MESSVVVGIGSLTVAVVGLLLAYSFGKRRELGCLNGYVNSAYGLLM
jgi:hypothetical protein